MTISKKVTRDTKVARDIFENRNVTGYFLCHGEKKNTDWHGHDWLRSAEVCIYVTPFAETNPVGKMTGHTDHRVRKFENRLFAFVNRVVDINSKPYLFVYYESSGCYV